MINPLTYLAKLSFAQTTVLLFYASSGLLFYTVASQDIENNSLRQVYLISAIFCFCVAEMIRAIRRWFVRVTSSTKLLK